MSRFRYILLTGVFVFLSYFGFAQSGFLYAAETLSEGVTTANFNRSTVSPCTGTANWRTTQFRSGVSNVWRSPHVSVPGASFVSINFNYKVVVAAGTGTWTISVDLYSSGTFVDAVGTVTGTSGTSGASCLPGNVSKNFGTPLTNPVEVRFTITTTNTTITSSNYVQIDDVFSYFDALASPQSSVNGLTQPSYSTGTRNTFKYSSGEMFGDVFVTKSIQSGISSCTGVSDPDAPQPICKLTSVNAIHEVKRINKTTGDITYGVLETFSIPYQTGTFEKAYTHIQLESATEYYVHYFTVPTVESSGNALYWRTYEVAQADFSTAPSAFATSISTGQASSATACTLTINSTCYAIGGVDAGAYIYADKELTVPVGVTAGTNLKRIKEGAISHKIKVTSGGYVSNYYDCD